MLLSFADQRPFATGAVPYRQHSIGGDTSSARLVLPVLFGDISVEAVLDTGTPWVICAPQVAQAVGLNDLTAMDRIKLLIRGTWVQGTLQSMEMTISASLGENLVIEVIAFVPEMEYAETWGTMPSFLGLTGCLERFRFAVDPATDTLYFGSLV
jgi:predicted aspartyl protease